MTSRTSSGNDSNLSPGGVKKARTEKHLTRESGNAALWIIILVAALVIVGLAMLMGRGKEHSQDDGSPPPQQVQEKAKQDARPREHVRVQKPADPQRRPDRAHRPPPPGAHRPPPPGVRRPEGPPVPPHDPRERQRALQGRYDTMKAPPAEGVVLGEQPDLPPELPPDFEADVAGNSDQASPS